MAPVIPIQAMAWRQFGRVLWRGAARRGNCGVSRLGFGVHGGTPGDTLRGVSSDHFYGTIWDFYRVFIWYSWDIHRMLIRFAGFISQILRRLISQYVSYIHEKMNPICGNSPAIELPAALSDSYRWFIKISQQISSWFCWVSKGLVKLSLSASRKFHEADWAGTSTWLILRDQPSTPPQVVEPVKPLSFSLGWPWLF